MKYEQHVKIMPWPSNGTRYLFLEESGRFYATDRDPADLEFGRKLMHAFPLPAGADIEALTTNAFEVDSDLNLALRRYYELAIRMRDEDVEHELEVATNEVMENIQIPKPG